MARESGWLSESYYTMLWGSRDWKDVYKVEGYLPGMIDNADKELY